MNSGQVSKASKASQILTLLTLLTLCLMTNLNPYLTGSPEFSFTL